MLQFCPRFAKGRHEHCVSRALIWRTPCPGEISVIRGKLTDHIGDHVVLSPEGVVLVTSPGTASSYPRLPQLMKYSSFGISVERKQITCVSLNKNNRMLKFRGNLHYLNVPLADKFSKKMVTYVNMH